MVKAMIGIIAVAVLSGCTATTSCGGFKALRFTPATIGVMTSDELTQVNAHNRLGASRCGWRP